MEQRGKPQSGPAARSVPAREATGEGREKPGEGAWRWSTARDPCELDPEALGIRVPYELDPEALGICTVISFIPVTVVAKSSRHRPEDYGAELCRTAGARTSRLERGAPPLLPLVPRVCRAPLRPSCVGSDGFVLAWDVI